MSLYSSRRSSTISFLFLLNRLRFTQETIFGKDIKFNNLDKVQGIIIRLRENEDAEKSRNTLIAMLEELLKKESVEIKKKNFQMIMI